MFGNNKRIQQMWFPSERLKKPPHWIGEKNQILRIIMLPNHSNIVKDKKYFTC